VLRSRSDCTNTMWTDSPLLWDVGAALLTAVAAAAVLSFWEVVADRGLLDQVTLAFPFFPSLASSSYTVYISGSLLLALNHCTHDPCGIRRLSVSLLGTSIRKLKICCNRQSSMIEMNVGFSILPWKLEERKSQNKSTPNYENIYLSLNFLCISETLQETGAHICWIGVFPYVAVVQVN
jgi:hypothetical protein